jgi:dienelactone hydrolase
MHVLFAWNLQIESFVKIYPGVAHGWTVRYDVNDDDAVAKAHEAHNKTLEWFGKYLG